MNLENEISAQPTVQTNREVITTNGCKVTLEFSPQPNPQVKHDIAEIKRLLNEHTNSTGSPLGKRILENFDEFASKFKKIVPVDYSRMLQSISQMEEKGLSKEQAEIEAFYMNTGR